MTEIALVLVIFALCSLVAYMDHSSRKERKTLINALQAKDATEYAQLELTDKTKVEVKKEKEELVSMDDIDPDRFLHIIREENGN